MENETPIEVPVLIVIGTIIILVFIFFIILFVLFYQKKALETKAAAEEKEKAHQRQLLNATIEIAEEERKRIANNLHDDIGAMINLVKLNIGKMDRNNNDKLLLQKLGSESSDLLETTMENIRNISRDLAPPVLMKLGFEEGLIDLCNKISTVGVAKVTLVKANEAIRLPKKIELQLYRIIQELLNNVIKHSSASEINIALTVFSDKFAVSLTHNGMGIDNEKIKQLTEASTGLGLKSIQSRAQITNTSINYMASPNLSSITLETLLYEKAL